MMNEFKVKGKELLEKVEELIKEGNARRIIIKDEKGRTYLEIPVTIGILGALFAPSGSRRTCRNGCQFYN